MIKKLLLINLFLFCFQIIFAQSEDDSDYLLMYKTMIEKSDSLKSIGKLSEFKVKNIEEIAKNLDKNDPSNYFETSYHYFKDSKYNESAFLFHLGKMRTEDYNKSGKGYYEPRGDIGMILEEGIFMYLATDIDNYKKILKMAVDFYNKNEYTFISKTKNYHKLINPTNYTEIIDTFQNNRKESEQDLKKGREEMTSKIYEYLPLLEKENSKSK